MCFKRTSGQPQKWTTSCWHATFIAVLGWSALKAYCSGTRQVLLGDVLYGVLGNKSVLNFGSFFVLERAVCESASPRTLISWPRWSRLVNDMPHRFLID